MAIEIERKFLLANDAWRSQIQHSTRIAQGYLATDPTVRVRVKGTTGFLTIKGKSADGISRAEFEYPIPVEDALELLNLCPNVLDKTRHLISQGNLTWEIDEFHGDNAGLIVAELELPAIDTPFEKPDWLGQEVTGDVRYYNSMLSQTPYCRW
ncbi:adenylate cyclase [Formivibrio citricus]|uniref:Adenylate cyclase n=1 Tax=Formivibrio citricus TaxID=83765 RepID=A0A1I4ZF38_9NEIS|nr:CYTH domain-containing protein [Formivibrio citricus]SFN48881.1 adenylate cyclase [Formivibrio citricus]